ncbi:hypothetical protein TNIN_299201 [Trichonephila inaurata madagascariensis]|uniref:Uncharacterized protein n=1 Tax=Trichonephila inaurata madagascariensis TaxID=2747483 RepID=A0A8X6Y1F8_9ARAC|nr:hypothetical protein TNIN_299201 [Trichonephila inaurata madagascariensis]
MPILFLLKKQLFRKSKGPDVEDDDVEKDLTLMGINRWKALGQCDRVKWRRISLGLQKTVELRKKELIESGVSPRELLMPYTYSSCIKIFLPKARKFLYILHKNLTIEMLN